MNFLFDPYMGAARKAMPERKQSEESEMLAEANFQMEVEKSKNRKRFVRRLYCKFLRLFKRKKSRVVIDKSQFYELERLQMVNFPSVREYEMAMAEFRRNRCE